MTKITALTVCAAAMFASSAIAQTTPPPASSSGSSPMQLSQSECTSLWQTANASNAAGLTEAQAKPYVSDFKAANPDGDTTIDQAEWLAACNKGLVKSAASTGTSSGSSGSSTTGPSSKTPAANPPKGDKM